MHKILFAHNSLPEYRVGWFQELTKISDCRFLITNPAVANKIYGYTGAKNGIDCMELPDGIRGYTELYHVLKNNSDVDFIELPPIDTVNEFVKSAILLVYAKRKGIKTGYFWEKWEAPRDKQPLTRIIKNHVLGVAAHSLYKWCDVIYSVGRKNKDYFLSYGISESKIRMIPDSTVLPVCKHKNIRRELEIPETQIFLLYFGRIIEQKGLDYLINAIALLDSAEQKKICLVVAGDGPFRHYCSSLAEKIRDCSIHFVGAVNPSIRRNYFEQCDVFIHPGRFYKGRTDVWGLTLNEAVACGKIIVSTTAVGSSYELVNSRNGYVVCEGNTVSLKDALHNLIVNYDKLKLTAIEENEKLSKKYSVKNMAYEYVHALDTVIDEEEC